MGLSWISPLFLYGLALLALPVLIHLVQKQHMAGMPFPSLMFLQRIPQRERRRLEIRNWLLLLLRCLLLLLLVLAFARPFSSTADRGGALDPGRSDSIILLDRSYSMRIADHWRQAQDTALGLVEQKKPADRIGIIVFDDEPEILSDLTASAVNLNTLLRGPAPGFGTTRLAPAIEQAARLLAGSNASRRVIFVISDFQAWAAPSVPRIGEGIEITALPVDITPVANVALGSVSIEPSSGDAGDEFAISVEVTNLGPAPQQRQLTLTLDGREFARRELQLAPGAVRVERFDRLGVGGDLARGIVGLDDDALALDNRAYFVYSSRQQVPILIVNGLSPRANQSVYLEHALRLSRQPLFRVEQRALDGLKPADLRAFAAIVMNDVAMPDGELGEALEQHVAAGAALLLASGEATPGPWPQGAADYLPGTPGRRVEAKPGQAYRIAEFESGHPLSLALGARKTIDISLASIFSYRALQPGTGDRVIARYDDGGIALLERRIGRGRVMLLTTTLDGHWNDLALQPGFLPFLHQGLLYLTAFESYPHQTGIGDIADVLRYARALAGADAVAAAGISPLTVETPSARAIRLERQSPLLTIEEPGFYQVHHATPAAVEVTLAANIDPRESSQERLDVDRFVEEIRASAEPAPVAAAPTRRQAAGYERQQRFWYTILSVALVLTLVEALSANWIGARRSNRNPGAGRAT